MFMASVLVALKELFLPLTIVVCFLGGLIVAIASFATRKERTSGFAAFLMSFGFLGGVTGLMAGASRESLLGGLLTGLLGIMSALLSYLFSKETLKEWRPYIPYAITLLVLSSLAGTSIGGIYKARWEEFDRQYKRWFLEYEKVYLEALKQEQQRDVLPQSANGQKPSPAATPAAPLSVR